METTIKLRIEKEAKHSIRYAEIPEPGQPPIIGSLYVQKWFAGDAKELEVTIKKG